MTPAQLKNDFLRLCNVLKDRSDVLYTQVQENKRDCVFNMYFHAIRVELVYCWKWEALAPPSILYSRFYLNKNEDLFLHLPELIAQLEAEDYRACYFPYIETTQRMEACFEALMQLVDDYSPAAQKLVQSGTAEEIMKLWFEKDFFNDQKTSGTVWEYDDAAQRQQIAQINYRFEGVMVGRHTNFPAYEAFQLGNWEKARKLYEKQEKRGITAYERGLIRFMNKAENQGFQSMPSECFSLPNYKKFARNGRELAGIGILWIVFSAIFCAIIAIYDVICGQGTVYHFGVPIWFGIALGFWPALLGYASFQHKILAWMQRKIEIDYATMLDTHPKFNKFILLLFILSIIGCMLLNFNQLGMCERYYSDHAICYRDRENTVEFNYYEVADIYYIKSRYNDYGDIVHRSSYVIALKDGTCIDLDGSTNLKNQERLVQKLFGDHKVIQVETDRDLPGNRI